MRVPRTLRLVGHQVRINAMMAMEYRIGFLIYMVNTVVRPTVALLVWLTVLEHSERGAAGAAALPFDRAQLVTYFILMALVSMVTSAWGAEYLAEDIRTGGLSKHLLRPAPVLVPALGNNVGEKVVKLGLLLPLVALMALFFREYLQLPAEPGRWALLGVALLLAAALNFVLDCLIGSLAFWLQNVSSVGTLEALLSGLLAGRFVPLAFFPTEVRGLLELQPWRYVLSFPIEIATAGLGVEAVARGLAIQVTYLLVLGLLLRRVWGFGIRAYAAVGA